MELEPDGERPKAKTIEILLDNLFETTIGTS